MPGNQSAFADVSAADGLRATGRNRIISCLPTTSLNCRMGYVPMGSEALLLNFRPVCAIKIGYLRPLMNGYNCSRYAQKA
jgi:hypothetical protein